MSFLKRNLENLPEPFARVLKEYKEVGWIRPVRSPKAPKGVFGVAYLSRNQSWLTNSLIDPATDNKALLAKYDFKHHHRIWAWGFGCGYFFDALFKRDPDLEVWIAMIDIPNIYFALHNRDLSKFFLNPKIHWINGTEDEILAEYEICRKMGVGAGPVPEAYNSLEITGEFPMIQKIIYGSESAHEYLEQNGEEIRENIKSNLYSDTVYGINDIKGLEKGKRAIIVAAAPSLDERFDELIALSKEPDIVVIALGQTCVALRERGVKYHFLTYFDQMCRVASHIDEVALENKDGAILVHTAETFKGYVEKWKGDKLVAIDMFSAFIPLNARAELAEKIGSLDHAASVATFAIDLARHIGCSEIHMFGYDNGFRDLEHTHHERYTEKESAKKAYGNNDGEWYPSVKGDQMFCPHMMIINTVWTNDWIKANPEIKLFNYGSGRHYEGSTYVPKV